jgi:hypothetical protein
MPNTTPSEIAIGFHAVAIVENYDVTHFNVQRLHSSVFQDAALTDSDNFATR